MMRSPSILVVVGPTAIGKSKLALRLAKDLNGEIVVADSMQVYKHFDIGTGKATVKHREEIPHHLIDMVDPTETFSAAKFVEHADFVIEEICKRGSLPIIDGGTGLYVRALLHGLFDAPNIDPKIRDAHQKLAEHEGIAALYKRLQEVDPISAEGINSNDFVRISRALEVYEQTGKRISDLRQSHGFAENRYSAVIIGLKRDTKIAHELIDKRVDKMMENGWLQEVQSLLSKGYGDTHPMGALGYRHLYAYLRGELDLSEAVRQTKRDTRRFARRQRNWFGAESGVLWVSDPESVDANWIVELLEKLK